MTCRICTDLINAGLGKLMQGCPFCHRMELIELTDRGIGYTTTSYKDIEGAKPWWKKEVV